MLLKNNNNTYVDTKDGRTYIFKYPGKSIYYFINGYRYGLGITIENGKMLKYYDFKDETQGKYDPQYYVLNNDQRYFDDSYRYRYRYAKLIDAYYDENDDIFEDIQNLNKDEKIREHRIIHGLNIEWKLNEERKRYGYDVGDLNFYKLLIMVIGNLSLYPGEYDPMTYEQLKPDYYHILDQLN